MSHRNRLTHNDLTVYSLTDAIELELDLKSFKCEKKKFNNYFHKTAYKDHNENIGKVWVFTEGRKKKVIGFVTLAMSSLGVKDHVKLSDITHYPHVPALLLGQMARDSEYEGRGLGKLMMDWVIIKALEFGGQVGCRLVMLDSVPDKVELYSKWGFVIIDLKADNSRKNRTMFVDLAWFGHWVLPK